MNKIWKIVGFVLVMLVLGSVFVSAVSAASDSTEQIKSSEVVTLVDERYIPKSVQAMKSRGESESVNDWEDAKAGIPILQYWLNEGKNKIEPHFWIIPVKKDDNTVGFIGVDPYTGKFVWRILGVDKSYKIQRPSNSTFENLVELQRFRGGYDISKVKLVLIRDNNYWLIPLKDGDVNNSVLVDYNITNLVEKFGSSSPEVLGSITKVSEILTKPFGGFKPEVGGVKGVPARKFSKKIINSREQIVEASNLGGNSNTWIKDKIPYYKQDCSQWCWAACLAMMHQWWSPAEIGTSYYQEAQKIVKYEKGSIVCDPANLDEIVHVLNNWDQVDNNKNDYDGVAYEDWITADGDTNGKEFNKNDNPTGYFNDPKSWIYYLDSPVLLGVDTNGDETGNHAILCVGYDDNDNDGVTFINDPWYSDSFVPGIQNHNYEIGVSYDYLNEIWTLSGLLWEDRVWASGCPGGVTTEDYDLADTSISLKNCPNAIYDDEEALITIEMDILDDDTAYTTSYFGEWAESGIHVRTTSSDGVTGNGMVEVNSKENFNGWTGYSGRNGEVVCDSSSSSTGEAKIFEFYTDNNNQGDKLSVSFKIDPSDTGTISLYYRSWVYDWDNRVHFSDTSNDALWINVLDDRGGDDTDFTMPKPLKRDASDPSAWLYQNYLDIGSHSKAITVQDDDASGPNLDDYADDGDIYDSDTTPYVIATKWSDLSGISSVEYKYKFGSGSWSSWSPGTQLGSNWHYEISRNTWINHVGKTIYWEARATDNDNDRSNDKSTSYSGTKTGGIISDDDISPPTISNMKSEPTSPIPDSHNSHIRLKADITDSSEISEVDFVYRYDGGIWKTKNPTGHSGNTYYFDIPKSEWGGQVGDEIEWKVIATDDDNDRSNDKETGSKYGAEILIMDTTPPLTPTISSSTHPNETNWYANNDPAFAWNTPSDTSGIEGYSYTIDHSSSTTPDTSVDTPGNSASYSNIADSTWYFHARAKDNAGNWGSADHYTVKIDAANPSATLNSPNGGEIWQVGTQHDITWTATDNVGVTSVDIMYSINGGSTYPYTIATGETNDGTYSWTIPNTPSTTCKVKVIAYDVADNPGEDVSNANFEIYVEVPPPQLVVYTITNKTITPPQTTEINVAFSEEVAWIIAIEGSGVIYDWSGTATNPTPKTWDGTYEVNGTRVPDGIYHVNVTGTSTTTGLSVANNTGTITVTSAPSVLTSIEVIPSTSTLDVGDPQQFTATAHDQFGNEMTNIIFAWTSSNTTVGTINDAGYFTALAAGATTINATNGSIVGSAYVTVWSGGLSGDINGDGIVDYRDGPFLVKHVLGIPGYETIHADGDVNCDGVVDYRDGPFLVKHVLGIPGYEHIC